MIFKEARGAVERFVAGQPFLSEELRLGVGAADTWAALARYLSDLYDALDQEDRASKSPGERGGPIFEFYDRGLARIREYARSQRS